MDKSNGRKVLREKACQKQKQKFSSSAVYPGCGYVEVMDALVEQVMEPQRVQPRSVNIETFAWGYNGEDKLQGMSEMLQKWGLPSMPICLPLICRQSKRLRGQR